MSRIIGLRGMTNRGKFNSTRPPNNMRIIGSTPPVKYLTIPGFIRCKWLFKERNHIAEFGIIDFGVYIDGDRMGIFSIQAINLKVYLSRGK